MSATAENIICIMMDKNKDTDLGFDTELMIEIEEALRDPSLKIKIKNSINKMNSLQEQNMKLSKELEEVKRALVDNSRKSTFTKDDDLLDSNEESKEDNQKNKLGKGEAKVIKHKTGSGTKTKKIIAFNKNLKDIDGQKINSKLNAGKSDKKFGDRQSEDSSTGNSINPECGTNDVNIEIDFSNFDSSHNSKDTIEIITENQISESLTELRLLLQVFEGKAMKFLFADKYSVDVNSAKDIFQNKLTLGASQAEKLAKFLIESKPLEGLQNKNSTLSSQEIINKIEAVVGKYRKYTSSDIQELIESFYSPQND